MPNLMYTLLNNGEEEFITVIAPGHDPLTAREDHPHYEKIFALVRKDDLAALDLFDIAKTVETKFMYLSERISAKNGQVFIDGDPVNGTLADQIIHFIAEGQDFQPLVNFYEKLVTNPLGDVREGLFSWIKGQRESGPLTITPEGDILGYKSLKRFTPEYRTEETEVFVPSRRGEGIVNGRDVETGEYIEQVPGDVVQMPRSKVLHAPSQACGDGLHIGTWGYAKSFSSGGCDTVMLVRFSPRDIVSLPDGNSSWKLRVCRYTVVEQVTSPLSAMVYNAPTPEIPSEPAPVVPEPVNNDPEPEPQKRFEIEAKVLNESGQVYVVQGYNGPGVVRLGESRWSVGHDEFEDTLTEVKDGPEWKVGDEVYYESGIWTVQTYHHEDTGDDDEGYFYVITTEDGDADWYVEADQLQAVSGKPRASSEEDERREDGGEEFAEKFPYADDRIAERPTDLNPVYFDSAPNPAAWKADYTEAPWIPSAQDLDETPDPIVVETPEVYVASSVDDTDHPSEDEFNTMKGRAKRRKRNFAKYATKNGWTLVGADEDERSSWTINA